MTPKTVYYTASSMDGFIAGPGDDLNWLVSAGLATSEDSPFDYSAFEASVGAIVMSANTYAWVLDHHPEMTLESWSSVPSWVVTHRALPPIEGAPMRFHAARSQTSTRASSRRPATVTSGWSAGVSSPGSSWTPACSTRSW